MNLVNLKGNNRGAAMYDVRITTVRSLYCETHTA